MGKKIGEIKQSPSPEDSHSNIMENLPNLNPNPPLLPTALSPLPPLPPSSSPPPNYSHDASRNRSPSKSSENEGKQVNVGKEAKIKKKRGRKAVKQSSENALAYYLQKKMCEMCFSKENEEQLLLCDRCDDSYHLKCLNPPEQSLPEVWICPICTIQQISLETIKEERLLSAENEVKCFKCLKKLGQNGFITGMEDSGQVVKVECKSLQDLTCLYCKHTFHNTCFNIRKNALNCSDCETAIRGKGPKSHDQFMSYIEKQATKVKESDYCLLEHEGSDGGVKSHRQSFNFRVPKFMTSWQLIVQNQASLYYAFETKRLTFVDDQIYHNSEKDELMGLNSPFKELEGNVLRLTEKDQKVYEAFKQQSKRGFVGPFQVKEDRVKGFYLVATDFIEPFTIVSEYSGEVMKSRDALNHEENDSIFMLVKTNRSAQSLDVVPEQYGNISRFFSGINNSCRRKWSKLENIKALRFSYRGKVHILLYTKKEIQAQEILYFDYNGSEFHEYPTEHFVH